VKQFSNNVYDISQDSRQHIASQPDVARGPLIEYAAICHWIFLNCGHRKQSNNDSEWYSSTFRRFSYRSLPENQKETVEVLFLVLFLFFS